MNCRTNHRSFTKKRFTLPTYSRCSIILLLQDKDIFLDKTYFLTLNSIDISCSSDMIMFLKPFKFWKMLPSCSVRNIIFWLCLIHLKKLYIDLILSILGLFLWSVKHISLYSSVYKILFFIVTIHLFYSLVSFILVCHRVCLEEFESWKAFKCLQERSVLTCKQMDNRYPHSRNSQFLCRWRPTSCRGTPWYIRLQDGLRGDGAFSKRLNPQRTFPAFFKTFHSVTSECEANMYLASFHPEWTPAKQDGAPPPTPLLASPLSSLLYLPSPLLHTPPHCPVPLSTAFLHDRLPPVPAPASCPHSSRGAMCGTWTRHGSELGTQRPCLQGLPPIPLPCSRTHTQFQIPVVQ